VARFWWGARQGEPAAGVAQVKCAWERARVSGSERLVAARVQTPGKHIG
jgi:hypothetical protein